MTGDPVQGVASPLGATNWLILAGNSGGTAPPQAVKAEVKILGPLCILLIFLSYPGFAQESLGTLVRLNGVVKIQESNLRGPTFHPRRDGIAPQGGVGGSTLGREFHTRFLPWNLATPGQALAPGSTIETSAAGEATVALNNGVQLHLHRGTRVRLPVQPGGRVRLLQGKAWLNTERALELGTPKGELSLEGDQEVVLTVETSGVSLAVLEGQVSAAGTTVEAGQSVSLFELPSQARSVEIQLQRPDPWVKAATTPQSFLLPSFFSDDIARAQARKQGLAGDPILMAKVHLDEGRPEEALASLRGQEQASEFPVLMARVELLRQDFTAAEKHQAGSACETLAGHDAFQRGLVAWADFRLARARVLFEESSSEVGVHAQAALGYLVDFQQGHYRQAAERLERALEVKGEPVWHRQLGDAYASLSRNGAATDSYKRALNLSPGGDPSTSLRLANLLTRMGRREAALAALGDYQEGSLSATADIHYNLAAAFAAVNDGRLKEAWEFSEKALSSSQALDPGLRYLALDLQGLILSRRRQFSAAVRTYRRALESSPGDPFLRNDIALALSRSGDLYEALDYLTQARDQAPESATIHANLGVLYSLLGQPQRAQSELQRATRLLPDNGRIQQELGLVMDNSGLEEAGDRLKLQSTILDPLVIAPRPSQAFLSVETDPLLDPRIGAGYSANIDGVAVGLFTAGEEEAEARAGDGSQENFLSVGTHLSERDRLWGQVGAETERKTGPEPGETGYERANFVEAGYYRELSPRSSVWAVVSHVQGQEKEHPAFAERPDDGAENSQLRATGFELRFDHQVSVNNVLRAGFSGLDQNEYDTEVVQFLGDEVEVADQSFRRFWVQDEWAVTPELNLIGGVNLDQVNSKAHERGVDGAETFTSATATKANPYLGLVYQPNEDTQISLGVVRESDISLRANDGERFNVLAPVLLNNTTQFPLRVDDFDRMKANSLTGEVLPVVDYRLQLRQELGRHLFLTSEAFVTEVMPSDIQDPSDSAEFNTDLFDDLDVTQLRLQERSRLQGGRLDLEMWDGGGTVATVGYRYRDYRFLSAPFKGNSWSQTPQHEVQARVLRQLFPGLVFELSPFWRSGSFADRENQGLLKAKAGLTPFLHWQPLPELLLSVGYRELLSSEPRPQDPRGWGLRLFSRF